MFTKQNPRTFNFKRIHDLYNTQPTANLVGSTYTILFKKYSKYF